MSRRRFAMGLTALACVAGIIGLTQCRSKSSNPRRATTQSPMEPSTAQTPPRSAAPASSGTSATTPSGAAAQSSAVPEGGDSRSTFSRLTHRYEENDLRLIAEVQRETNATSVPDSIERLIEARRSGATEAELQTRIDTEVHGLKLKVAARRWLARQFPGSRPESAPVGRKPSPVRAPTRRRPIQPDSP